MTNIQTQLDENRRKVDVDHFDVTLREIIRMVSEGELKTAPDYQRKFRWSLTDESRLIESLFLGLPVPSIFVATNSDGTWEIVDGLQRVSTIVHFAADSQDALMRISRRSMLRLSDLEKLTEISTKTFAELPTPVQLGFYKRMLRVTALSDKSDLEVRFDMFERLNNGGIALTPQEVRACVYRGEFIDLVEVLAQDIDFKAILKLQSTNEDDGTKEEIVLKMFAYLYNRENFKGEVKSFLNDFAENVGKKQNSEEVTDLFRRTVAAISTVTNLPIVPTRVSTTPINQLEGILVGAADLIRNGVEKFAPQSGWLDDANLVYFSTKGTNTRRMLNGRIDRARELLQGADVLAEYQGPD